MATSKKNDFKKIKDFANKQVDRSGYRFVTLWDYNGKKFRITFENSNGTPCGFDYKHCVDVFVNDQWLHVADKNDILAFAKGECNCTDYLATVYQYGVWNRVFTEACIEYIKVLYS